MANPFAANFGDVVKHTVLCAVVENERPSRYLESHAGRLDYDLATLDPGPGGVWDFLERASAFDSLSSSTYAASSGGRWPDENPGDVPGSIALADAILPEGIEVISFELVQRGRQPARGPGRPRPTGAGIGRRRADRGVRDRSAR